MTDAANQSTPQGAESRSRSTLVCQLRRLAGAGALVRGRAQSVGLKPMCGNSGEICTCRARTKAKALATTRHTGKHRDSMPLPLDGFASSPPSQHRPDRERD